MASKVIVLALLLVAILGMASAADTSAEAPISDDVIGTDDGSEAGAPSMDGLVAGPLGSSTGAGSETTGEAAGPSGAEAPSKSDAAVLKVSAIAGVAAAAGYFF